MHPTKVGCCVKKRGRHRRSCGCHPHCGRRYHRRLPSSSSFAFSVVLLIVVIILIEEITPQSARNASGQGWLLCQKTRSSLTFMSLSSSLWLSLLTSFAVIAVVLILVIIIIEIIPRSARNHRNMVGCCMNNGTLLPHHLAQCTRGDDVQRQSARWCHRGVCHCRTAAGGAVAVAVTVAIVLATRRQMQFRRRCEGLCVIPG